MIIGITGGTGSGKTTFLGVIRQMGGIVLDCDAIYHNLLNTDKSLLAAIEERFPGTVTEGTLDRKALGNVVFSDEEALQDLNRITHRVVKEAVLLELQKCPELAAIDAIGLFEGGLADLCDVTVAITAPEEVRIDRLVARDGISREYAAKRIRAQKNPEEFIKRCRYHLENNGTEEAFREKCLAFLKRLDIMKEKP